MSSVRQAVEWGFGKILTEFAFLDLKKNQKIHLQEVGKMYKVGVLSTNCHTCLYGSQGSNYFNILPPTLEQYLNLHNQ
ncbi:DDE Tnp4 domain-containing protein [Aphis craccivora]|uniref:DDE Tnp4 domain-containing protein n=1 Tax=Aphis craccivora TaxID=307492 RepID=A0A6G0VL46_APHCR|nr:DDE Tnp4 domain-containing protein [Aphis craccivora]